MGDLKAFDPVKVFLGVLLSSTVDWDTVKTTLIAEYGTIDYVSDMMDFTYSNYYTEEMGSHLKRCFVSLQKPFPADKICSLKLKSNDIEARFSRNGNRKINIDPGIITPHNLILLTTKNYAHRIPIQSGIYAEVTLIWSANQFQKLPWTYPDYQSEAYQAIFKHIRNLKSVAYS